MLAPVIKYYNCTPKSLVYTADYAGLSNAAPGCQQGVGQPEGTGVRSGMRRGEQQQRRAAPGRVLTGACMRASQAGRPGGVPGGAGPVLALLAAVRVPRQHRPAAPLVGVPRARRPARQGGRAAPERAQDGRARHALAPPPLPHRCAPPFSTPLACAHQNLSSPTARCMPQLRHVTAASIMFACRK